MATNRNRWIESGGDPNDFGFSIRGRSTSGGPMLYASDEFMLWHSDYQDHLLEEGVCAASDDLSSESQSDTIRAFFEWLLSIPFVKFSSSLVGFILDLLGEFIGGNFISDSNKRNSNFDKVTKTIGDYSFWIRQFEKSGHLGKGVTQILKTLRDTYGLESLALTDDEIIILGATGAISISEVLGAIVFLVATYYLVQSLIDDGTFANIANIIETLVTGSSDDPKIQSILRKLYWALVDPYNKLHH